MTGCGYRLNPIAAVLSLDDENVFRLSVTIWNKSRTEKMAIGKTAVRVAMANLSRTKAANVIAALWKLNNKQLEGRELEVVKKLIKGE